jgi:hypothetical protein
LVSVSGHWATRPVCRATEGRGAAYCGGAGSRSSPPKTSSTIAIGSPGRHPAERRPQPRLCPPISSTAGPLRRAPLKAVVKLPNGCAILVAGKSSEIRSRAFAANYAIGGRFGRAAGSYPFTLGVTEAATPAVQVLLEFVVEHIREPSGGKSCAG